MHAGEVEGGVVWGWGRDAGETSQGCESPSPVPPPPHYTQSGWVPKEKLGAEGREEQAQKCGGGVAQLCIHLAVMSASGDT